MDLNIRILHHKDVIITVPNGEVDLEKSKQILLKLATLAAPPNDYGVLVDYREVTNPLTVNGMAQLVSIMVNHRDSFQSKLAILTQPGFRLDLAKFMELHAQNRGLKIAAFDSFESAMLWLSTTTDIVSESN